MMIVLYKLFFATAFLVSFVCVSPATNAQTVTFNTSVGDIVVELFPDEAPIAVANFLGYVERGDYDGTIFHRSVSDFVIQGGGFLLTGESIPLQPTIMNEFGRSNLRGTLANARVGGMVDSATSQFFFNVSDNDFLDTVDEGFTVFGEVVSGLEIVDSINSLPTFGAAPPFGELPVLEIRPDDTVFSRDLILLNGVTVESALLGDVNLDGTVSFLDIGPFVLLLSMSEFLEEADINQDDEVNFLDIGPFVSILTAG